MTHRGHLVAAVTGLTLLVAAMVTAALADDLRAAPGQAAAAFGVALAGALLVARSAAALAPPVLLWCLLGLRLVGLWGEPTLSDDIHRYIHEGRAQRLGLAVPYSVPPALVTPPPDDGTTARVNHPLVAAAYPPGSQLVLLATVAVGDSIGHPRLPLRLLLLGTDLAVLLLLYRQRRRVPSAFVRYGCHPLPLLEIALGGHLDGLGMAAVVAAMVTTRPLLAGALIGLASHVKPVAAVALLGLKRTTLPTALAGFALAVVLPALPYLIAGAPLHRGLLEYSTRWRASPFVYAALEAPLAPVFARRAAEGRYAHLHVGTDGLLIEDTGKPIVAVGAARRAERPLLIDAGFFARVLTGALLAAALAFIAVSRAAPEARVGYALLTFWLFAPTVHPWYLTWIVPFAALTRSRALWTFSAVSPLLYQPVFGFARHGAWEEDIWPRAVMVTALVLALVLDGLQRRERPA